MRASNFIVAVAGLTASAGLAQAADLPMAKAEAVEYVAICGDFGTGYFYIPGTDTCLKIGGLVRENIAIRQNVAGDPSSRARNNVGFATIGRLSFDARTATENGVLRSFIEADFNYSAGNDPTTATTLRYAYIQYMGFTAGLNRSVYAFFDREAANSLFDPYFTEQGRVNQLSYTAAFGKAYASLSVEDSRDHRSAATFGSFPPVADINGDGIIDERDRVPINYAGAALPDVVASIGYDDGKGGWGKVQAMGAVHQIRATAGQFDTTYGYAVGLGALFNLPVASGAYIAAEADYADGAVRYLNASTYGVHDRIGRARDAYADIADSELDGTKAWSATAEVGVTISPSLTWRAFGSYLDLNAPSVAGLTADYTVWTAGTHLAYSPVKNLLIVGEVDYIALDFDGTDTGDTDGWFGGMRIQRTF